MCVCVYSEDMMSKSFESCPVAARWGWTGTVQVSQPLSEFRVTCAHSSVSTCCLALLKGPDGKSSAASDKRAVCKTTCCLSPGVVFFLEGFGLFPRQTVEIIGILPKAYLLAFLITFHKTLDWIFIYCDDLLCWRSEEEERWNRSIFNRIINCLKQNGDTKPWDFVCLFF